MTKPVAKKAATQKSRRLAMKILSSVDDWNVAFKNTGYDLRTGNATSLASGFSGRTDALKREPRKNQQQQKRKRRRR